MHLASIILSFVLALLFAILLIFGFSRKGPGPAGGLFFFLFIIFMFSWAFGSWISPVGPVNYGIPWLGYLFLAFAVTLVLGVVLPPSKPPFKASNEPISEYQLFEKQATTYPLGITFGIFFWLTMNFLLVMGMVKIYYQM